MNYLNEDWDSVIVEPREHVCCCLFTDQSSQICCQQASVRWTEWIQVSWTGKDCAVTGQQSPETLRVSCAATRAFFSAVWTVSVLHCLWHNACAGLSLWSGDVSPTCRDRGLSFLGAAGYVLGVHWEPGRKRGGLKTMWYREPSKRHGQGRGSPWWAPEGREVRGPGSRTTSQELGPSLELPSWL